jgi:hypothetical protein
VCSPPALSAGTVQVLAPTASPCASRDRAREHAFPGSVHRLVGAHVHERRQSTGGERQLVPHAALAVLRNDD